MISKTADAYNFLSSDAAKVFDFDIFAGELYENILSGITGQDARSEFVRNIVRVWICRAVWFHHSVGEKNQKSVW